MRKMILRSNKSFRDRYLSVQTHATSMFKCDARRSSARIGSMRFNAVCRTATVMTSVSLTTRYAPFLSLRLISRNSVAQKGIWLHLCHVCHRCVVTDYRMLYRLRYTETAVLGEQIRGDTRRRTREMHSLMFIYELWFREQFYVLFIRSYNLQREVEKWMNYGCEGLVSFLPFAALQKFDILVIFNLRVEYTQKKDIFFKPSIMISNDNVSSIIWS